VDLSYCAGNRCIGSSDYLQAFKEINYAKKETSFCLY
jgi:hypothetical protein